MNPEEAMDDAEHNKTLKECSRPALQEKEAAHVKKFDEHVKHTQALGIRLEQSCSNDQNQNNSQQEKESFK